jgi:hypothetical protein
MNFTGLRSSGALLERSARLFSSGNCYQGHPPNRRSGVGLDIERQVLSISPQLVDCRLQAQTTQPKMRIYGSTKNQWAAEAPHPGELGCDDSEVHRSWYLPRLKSRPSEIPRRLPSGGHANLELMLGHQMTPAVAAFRPAISAPMSLPSLPELAYGLAPGQLATGLPAPWHSR